MVLAFNREELKATLSPFGYEIKDQVSGENKVCLSITHPAHEGTGIEIALLSETGTIDHLERVVYSGPEMALFTAAPFIGTPEFYELSTDQQNHLHRILLGEVFDHYGNFEDPSELVSLIEENIKVRPEL